MNESLFLLAFFAQIVLLYFLSRLTINKAFRFLQMFSKNDQLIFSLVSLIFFPGTIIHELSHFMAATVLFLKVRSIDILPRREGTEIKLGSVLYEKKDFVRGVLVGIAPIFSGVLIFWFVAKFRLFPAENILLNIVFLYLIFAISSMMFSSKKDLVDLIYIIPLGVFLYGFYYIFDLRLDFLIQNEALRQGMTSFIQQVNIYLLISLGVNLTLLFLFFTVKKILRR